MKRLLTGLALCLILSLVIGLAACTSQDAAQSKEGDGSYYRVGISQLIQHGALDAATQGFQDALIEKLGDKVAFDYQNAQGDPNTCASIANGFVASKVDLILANATPALQAAATATADIPVLGTSITEYGVALGLDNFTGTVGGNISGTSDLAPLDQQAQMIKDLFPEAEKVGLIYCSAEPNSLYQVDRMTHYLTELGLEALPYPFTDSNDLAAITSSAVREVDVIYLPTDNTVASNAGIIDNVCRPALVPVITGEKDPCAICGVATLTIDYYDLGFTTGLMAHQILTGQADISQMPIQYAPNFSKMFNPEICDALGLTMPDDYLPITG